MNKTNIRRILPIAGIIAVTFGVSAFFCFYQSFYIDEWLCIGFLDVLFLMLLIFEIEHARLNYQLFNNRATTFTKVFLGYFLNGALLICFSYLPAYSKPIIIFPIIMSALSNDHIGIITSIYWAVLLNLFVGGDYYELLSTLMLILVASILAQLVHKKKLRFFAYFILVFSSIITPAIFYYMSSKETNYKIFLYGFIIGLLAAFVLFVCSRFIKPEALNEIDNKLLDIIDDNYSQVVELKAFSKYEYEHAKRVSEISYQCAQKAGLNEYLCAAAGFYYRLGRWQGEPYIESGIKKAESLCFPESLVRILSEYYGELNKPSTPESALVHIVDALVIKMDKLHSEVGKSQWNNELIIYQTLNEFSSSGLYDQSNLGMNHFLVIRDCLAKEIIK